MRKLVIAGAMLATVVPAAPALAEDSPSPSQPQSASERCRAERTALGTPAFELKYGTNANRSNAFGKCVSRRNAEDNRNRSNAAKKCKAEQDDPNFAAGHNGQTFAQFYGTNRNGNNAFGKCVSKQAQAQSAEQHEARIEQARNAARTCRTERNDANFAAAHNGRTFAQFYGTNRNNRNAFGRCVSRNARA